MPLLSSMGVVAGSIVGGFGWSAIYRKRHKMDLILQELFESAGLVRHLHGRQVQPKFKKKRRLKNGWEMIYEIPLGLSISGALAHLDEWEEQLQADIQLQLSGREFKLEITHGHLYDLILWKPALVAEVANRELSIPIGITRSRTLYFDLEKDEPHLLVGGLTKSGKSSFLASAIWTLSLAKSPEEVQFYLIDGKWAVEFGAFTSLPHVKMVGESISEAKQILRTVENEIGSRAKAFREVGVRKLSTYTKKTNQRMPYIIVIVDELAQFKPKGAPKSEKSEREQLQVRLTKLAQTGRFAGVHLIVATQLPYAEVIGSELKQQCGATLAYRTRNKTGSQVLLERDDAADLPLTAGRAVFQMRNEMTVQTFLLREETQEKLIKQIRERWADYIQEDNQDNRTVPNQTIEELLLTGTEEDLYIGEEETEEQGTVDNVERLSLLSPEQQHDGRQSLEGS